MRAAKIIAIEKDNTSPSEHPEMSILRGKQSDVKTKTFNVVKRNVINRGSRHTIT